MLFLLVFCWFSLSPSSEVAVLYENAEVVEVLRESVFLVLQLDEVLLELAQFLVLGVELEVVRYGDRAKALMHSGGQTQGVA